MVRELWSGGLRMLVGAGLLLLAGLLALAGWRFADAGTAVPDPANNRGFIYVLTDPPRAPVGVDFETSASGSGAEVSLTVSPPGYFLGWAQAYDGPAPRVAVVLTGAARFSDFDNTCVTLRDRYRFSPQSRLPECWTVPMTDGDCPFCHGQEGDPQVVVFHEPGSLVGSFGTLDGETVGDYVSSGGGEVVVEIPTIGLYNGSNTNEGRLYSTFDLTTLEALPDAATGWGAPKGDESTVSGSVDVPLGWDVTTAVPAFSSEVFRQWGDCNGLSFCTDAHPEGGVIGRARFRDSDAHRDSQVFLVLAGTFYASAAAIAIALGGYIVKRSFGFL